MAIGQTYHDPQFRYLDEYSGREVIRITGQLVEKVGANPTR